MKCLPNFFYIYLILTRRLLTQKHVLFISSVQLSINLPSCLLYGTCNHWLLLITSILRSVRPRLMVHCHNCFHKQASISVCTSVQIHGLITSQITKHSRIEQIIKYSYCLYFVLTLTILSHYRFKWDKCLYNLNLFYKNCCILTCFRNWLKWVITFGLYFGQIYKFIQIKSNNILQTSLVYSF